MDRDPPDEADGAAGWLGTLVWTGLLLAVVAWQGWRTLALFGETAPWPDLWNDRIVTSGSHPQHYYFGRLGALGLHEAGTNCVYDPAFQAAYPKTPIFDGSRIAELAIFALGHLPPATAYKLGLAAVCLMVPVLVLLACWGAGVCGCTAAVGCALAILVWWGPPGQVALHAGDAEIFLAALAVLAHVGLLIRFDNDPGLRAWFGLLFTAALGWLAQPMLFPVGLVLLLVFYLSAGVKHHLPWHASLFAAEATALAVNLPWLNDWIAYWWLRSPPLPGAAELLAHRSFDSFWNAPLWGGAGHRLLALFLFASAVPGILIWNETRQRPAARLLGSGAVSLLVLALLGISWEPLGQMGTAVLLSPALWFACLPAAHAWIWLVVRLARSHLGRVALTVLVVGVAVGAYVVRDELAIIGRRAIYTEPLTFGLNADRQEIVEHLKTTTTRDARILWEDRKLPRQASRWSALLPLLTDRYFLGGLDPAGTIEHSSISFLDEALEGRHISNWSNDSLAEYCKRYNVGWVVAWSPATLARFRAWSGVERELSVRDDVPGALFILKPQGGSFVTRGHATIACMDSRHIALEDVVPDGGEVIINLHYLAGLKVSPGRVSIEREPSGHDPIGFIRLRMTDPVPRLTLTWDRSH